MITDLVVLPYPLVAKRLTAWSVPVFAGVPLAVPAIAPVSALIESPAGSPDAAHFGV